MARGRIISAVISQSRKVSEVSDQSALLFTWIQAHTDDYGRIEGETQDVLFLIVPRRGWTEAQVEGYLEELWKVGLLKQYHVDNRRYFEVYAFDEHQTFRSDRGRKAKYPVPEQYDDQWYTNDNQREKTDTEVKLSISKVKLSKVKVKSKATVGKPTADTPKETETKVITPKEKAKLFREVPWLKELLSNGKPTADTPKETETKVITPKEKAKLFFEGVRDLEEKREVPWLKELLSKIADTNQAMQRGVIWNEIRSFTDYWTELTHTGQRQRWECQKTFEVEKRLKTWFSRAGFKSFTTAGSNAKSGKGKNIIGLDDDENAI